MNGKLIAVATLLVLLCGRATSSAYYNPSTGRWLSRDPIGEEGGVNLYVYAGNDPVRRIDPHGLFWEWPSRKRKSSCPKCCCCAEDIRISGIHNVSTGFGLGHGFTTEIDLRYVLFKDNRDCKLEWWERSNHGYTRRMRDNVWTDMTQDPETASSFAHSWGARAKPCPGSETVSDYDEPRYSRLLGNRRVLEFFIVVTSAEGCPCRYRYVSITARQTIDPTTTPWTQEFIADSPHHAR
jgi:hypothetical protein